MPFNRSIAHAYNPKELGVEWLRPKPTQWELGQARVTLQQHRGKRLSGLPHEDLLQVAEAFQVTLQWFTIPEVDDEVLVAFRGSAPRQVKWELSEWDAVRISLALSTLRQYGRQPLASLPVADLLKFTLAVQSILQRYARHSNLITEIGFPAL